MASEKEITLRDWELLDDEQVVRSSATKGKFINSCICFLSERRNITITDAKKFFYDNVLDYVNKLINNRQIHRADLVLKNVGYFSRNVFFQVSKESNDPELREYLVEYYKKKFPDFENDLMMLEEEWFLFNELKKYKESVMVHFTEPISEKKMTELDFSYFDNFCRIDRALKDKMITFIFFTQKGKSTI